VKAKALGALPREMRDAIFEQLYVEAEPVDVTWSRIGDNIIFDMPKDKALYLSEWHVGPQIAMEAAEIFYRRNTFLFNQFRPHCSHGERTRKGLTEQRFDQWFDTDHFGSGVTPRGLVRKIDLQLLFATEYHLETVNYSTTSVFCIPDHAKFEAQCDENRAAYNAFDNRAQLDYLSNLDGLQELHITALYEQHYCDQLNRLISPYVRRIKANGIKVAVHYSAAWVDVTFDGNEEFTNFFDEPSANDYKIFEQVARRPKTPNPNNCDDPILSWWDWAQGQTEQVLYDNLAVNPGFVRVWLQEHFEVYTFYQKNKNLLRELDRIKVDVEGQNARMKAIGLRYFNRIVELMNPDLATPSAQAYRASGNPWG
jgi:hypothetical protein